MQMLKYIYNFLKFCIKPNLYRYIFQIEILYFTESGIMKALRAFKPIHNTRI